MGQIEDLLAQAREEGRREGEALGRRRGIEEAAKAVEATQPKRGYRATVIEEIGDGVRNACLHAIRALLEEPSDG